MPNDGDKIKLTWLPNPINAPKEKSAYIGMEGTVEGMDKIDGSFFLNTGNSILVCPRGSFNYIKLK